MACHRALFWPRFYSLSHYRLLLAILHYFGFAEDAIVLISNYLSDREQHVSLNGTISQALKVASGVPQGSILGPLLFTIYTANLFTFMDHCEPHFYADDTQIYLFFDSNDRDEASLKINNDLAALLHASENHCLTINPNKSVVMLFGRQSKREQCLNGLKISINNQELNISHSAKNLGLYIDQNLRFTDHVNKCIRRAYGNLKLIYGCSYILDHKSKILLCNSLVLSHFNYGDVIFHPCLTKLDELRIQRVQNACIRFIFGIKKFDHVSHKFGQLNWLSMKERRILHSCCLYQKTHS